MCAKALLKDAGKCGHKSSRFIGTAFIMRLFPNPVVHATGGSVLYELQHYQGRYVSHLPRFSPSTCTSASYRPTAILRNQYMAPPVQTHTGWGRVIPQNQLADTGKSVCCAAQRQMFISNMHKNYRESKRSKAAALAKILLTLSSEHLWC